MSKYNLRNRAVKRIVQEIKEMEEDQSPDFVAQALEDDIFEWHFVIRGPPETKFEGGLYHGRILLPPDYPFKPPSFIMLTKNGRFETGIKICLSISSHHPEHWQPSWGVRTALTALVAFMPTPGKGALGSLDFPAADCRELAQLSRTTIPKFGTQSRQQIADEVHTKAVERFRRATQGVGLPTSTAPLSKAQTETAHEDEREPQTPQATETCGPQPLGALPTEPVHRTNHSQLDVEHKDWGMALLFWGLLIMILALVAKKALTRAGIDVLSFWEWNLH